MKILERILRKRSTEKNTSELVQEIHETFYTEVDRLLAETKVLKPEKTDKQELIDKFDNLNKLGFTNVNGKGLAELEKKRLSDIKKENVEKEDLKKAIEYFSSKYPYYKFITEDSVKKICEKYNLIYGSVDKYIGNVPDKNIQEMLNFKIQEEDCNYVKEDNRGFIRGRNINYSTYLLYKDIESTSEESTFKNGWGISMRYSYNYYKEKFVIAAPMKDFDLTNMDVKNFKISKIEIPDPVVLQPVNYRNEKYFLIVTAWGDEAEDELVFNEKLN